MKKLIWLGLCFLFFVPLGAQEYSGVDGGEMKAPEFTLKDLDGNEISLSDFRGNYVVIHIATTWCPFCNAEAPHLEQLYREYHDKGVQVLLIDVKESRELVRSNMKEKYNLSFPVLIDCDGKVAARFAPPGVLPDLARDEVMLASNILVDREGMIKYMSLLDSRNFDARLVTLRLKLDEHLASN
ncbi:peroxiredoxin family protein [Robertkochia aurantiaca]|uniref:peroxiredoxin family protein n=1 Tax=Robertkochia aurantiaca TaxID=2873700 RepID=UPI001CC97B31|nr:TlpA disulfide reductase family protein [Robertkochia sp. 3YJGBD-33]